MTIDPWLIDSICVFESELFSLRRYYLNLEVQSGEEESYGADGRIYVDKLEAKDEVKALRFEIDFWDVSVKFTTNFTVPG